MDLYVQIAAEKQLVDIREIAYELKALVAASYKLIDPELLQFPKDLKQLMKRQ